MDRYGPHKYYDVSNLNARWDRDFPGGWPGQPVSGLGSIAGLGAGSIGGHGSMGILSGLGVTAEYCKHNPFSDNCGDLWERCKVAPQSDSRCAELTPDSYARATMMGLGYEPTPFMPKVSTAEAEKSVAYPWMVESENTKALQRDMNKELPLRGFAKLTVDGKLGPVTCGAHQVLGRGKIGTCKSYETPPRIGETTPTATRTPTAPIVTDLEEEEEEPTFRRAGIDADGTTWLWVGGALGLLAIGAAVVMAKEKGGRRPRRRAAPKRKRRTTKRRRRSARRRRRR